MPKRVSSSGSELFIIDNSDQEWKVLRYLHDWCQISDKIDVDQSFGGAAEKGANCIICISWSEVAMLPLCFKGSRASRPSYSMAARDIRRNSGRAELHSPDEKN